MKELRELQFEDEPIVLSERKAGDGDSMTVLVPWIQADKKNQNKRSYPLALLQREVARIQGAVKKGAFVGTGDHPAGGLADVATASHIVQKVWLDKKGKGWAEMKIIPTNRGENVMTLIDQDAQLGVSARGFGTVDEKTGEVQNDYKLVGIDIVTNPSYKEGTFSKSNIFESLDFEAGDAENKLEDKFNEDLSPKNNTDKTIIMESEMKLKDFKKEHPEEVKQIEDEKEAALKVEADKVVEAKDGEITVLGEKVKTLEDEKKVSEEEIKGLKEKVDKYVTFMRDLISSIGDQDDVLEGGEIDPNADPAPKETDKELESDLADAKKKIEALEGKDQAREDTAKTEKEATELQAALEPALAALLEKEEYVACAELIRKEVTDKDGNLTIESVEAVEDSVKAAFDRINEIRSAELKGKIIKDTDEKGKIVNPEGGGTEDEQKAKLITYYQEAVSAGERGTFDEWKEKFPRIVESVK